MRIRNRKVPLPLSFVSPTPLSSPSDPHLYTRSPVVQGGVVSSFQQPQPTVDYFIATSSENTPAADPRCRLPNTKGFEDVGEGGGVQTSNDDASNASISTTTIAPDNNEDRKMGKTWCEGDKAIPLKKRRSGIEFTTFVESSSSAIIIDGNTEMMTTTMQMKCKPSEEYKQQTKNNVVDDNNNAISGVATTTAVSAKKGSSSSGKRGNTIMEGSRCSRVNGRGWRCCQPTLVGYSLCEHHLGKGRLRSMTSSSSSGSSSVKPRSSSTNKKKNNDNKGSKFVLGRDDSSDEKKLERMSSFGNKRVKLGVVKARSLSSLLGQTNNTMNNNMQQQQQQQHEEISNLDYQ